MRYLLISHIVLVLISCKNTNRLNGNSTNDGYTTTQSGLKYKILQKGSGQQAIAGNEVLIRETTTYLNGTILYSNETSKSPVKVLIGGNQATNAVDEGLRGMRVGEIRQLIAGPDLVKRKSYPQNVSPDSTLMIKLILQEIIK